MKGFFNAPKRLRAGILTDSEDDNAVMRIFTQQMLKGFIGY